MDGYLVPLGNAPLQPSTDASTMSNSKVHSMIVQYCRDFVRTLPLLDDSGVPYRLTTNSAPTRGQTKEATMERITSHSVLERQLPSNPHYITRLSERAKAHKPPQGLWDDFHMKKARDEFYVPAGLRVLVICPELYDRDILKNSPAHRKKAKKSGGVNGYMTACPTCNRNHDVTCHKWSTEYASHKRSLNSELTQDIIIAMQYACRYPDCCAESKAKFKTFMVYKPEVWKLQPELIRRRYMDFVVDLGQKIGYSGTRPACRPPGYLPTLRYYHYVNYNVYNILSFTLLITYCRLHC